MKITFELVFITVVVIAIILLLFIYNKNSKKIKTKELEAKKSKEASKTEAVVDKKQDVSASDFSESRLKEDNYLHKIFSKDDSVTQGNSSTTKHAPRKSSIDDLLDLDIDFEEGVFDDDDFDRMFEDDDFDDDYDVGISNSSKKAKSELSEEFQNLSDDMKKLIITNVLNDKKSDE